MLIIPAIDIKDGRCVRLRQGRMEDETVFSESPHNVAKKWEDAGAERIHIVDLNGAVGGCPANSETIKKVIAFTSVPLQLGGGIRDMETLKAYFDLGISYIILGTVLYKNPEFVQEACRRYKNKIIFGIDSHCGKVAVEGWLEKTTFSPIDLVRKFDKFKPAAVVYTDIEKDGMQSGANVKGTVDFAERSGIPVIASGGIATLNDIMKFFDVRSSGITGVITGRALYEGTLDLKMAICKTKEIL